MVWDEGMVQLPEITTKEEAGAFLSEELSDWISFICSETDRGRKIDPDLLCDLADITHAVGKFLSTGQLGEYFRERPREDLIEMLAPLARGVTERMKLDREGDGAYAWLFLRNLERVAARVAALDGSNEAAAAGNAS